MAIKRSSESAFPEEEPEFQVAPLIDVLLVLLTFFMSITSTEILKTKSAMDIHLPVAKEGKEVDKKVSEVIINVAYDHPTKTGKMDFEEKQLFEMSEVTQIIMDRKQDKDTFRAVIRASQDVPYSYVQQVMQACAAAGVDNITFSVLNKSSKKAYDPNKPPQ
jgi:biopolymer transport protein ExbD